jgi:hypothetical protein
MAKPLRITVLASILPLGFTGCGRQPQPGKVYLNDFATFGNQEVAAMSSSGARDMAWVAAGDQYKAYEVLAIDRKAKLAVIAHGQDVFTLTHETPEQIDKKGDPVARRTSWKNINTWLAKYESEARSIPGYIPFDPQYEAKVDSVLATTLANLRASPSNRAAWIGVCEKKSGNNKPGNHIVILHAVPSQIPPVRRLFPNLTSADWKDIDNRYGRIYAARSTAEAAISQAPPKPTESN